MIEVQSRPEIVELDQNQFLTGQRNGFIKIDGKNFTVYRVPIKTQLSYYGVEIIDSENAIREMYKLAVSWGSDGIVNFEAKTLLEGDYLVTPIIQITGLAIKRK